MNKLLVTTSLNESWGTDEVIVFLGEWCKLYGNEHLWKNRDYSVIEYHWSDRNKAFHDFQYIKSRYNSLLSEFTIDLNQNTRSTIPLKNIPLSLDIVNTIYCCCI